MKKSDVEIIDVSRKSIKPVIKNKKEVPKKKTKEIIKQKRETPKKKSKISAKKKIIKKISKIINHGMKQKSPKKIIDTEQRMLTGIKGFDELFDKGEGIPSGAAVLVEGGPGSGKTIFCLTTLYNLCKAGKKCLYMSFEEPEEKLLNHMRNFGWNADECVKNGTLRIKRFDAIDVSRSIEALLSAAKKELLIDINPVFFPRDFEPDFVVIDSLTSIASAFTGADNRFRVYMEQLFRYLESNKITNFLIREVSSPSHIGTTFKETGEAVSFLSDGIIVMYNVIYENGNRGFATEILKMRGTSFKRKIVEMKIEDKKGLIVNSNKVLKKTKGSRFDLT